MSSTSNGMPVSDSEKLVDSISDSAAAMHQPDPKDESRSPVTARGGRLAVVRSYYDLIDALRKRVLDLGTDYEEVDRVAGYTDTYTSKLLAPRPSRNFGEVSLGSMLGALDKAVRAQSIRGRMSLIGLYVPAAAEWLPDLRAELLAFPTGKHDDIVDALGLVGQLMDKFAPGRLPPEAFEWKPDAGYSREIDVSGPLRDSFMTL
jgi:hypothetical protein